MKIALTIAGSDSGGGAGIQADLKTFAALGVYGASAITALTAQNTRGVQAVHLASTEIVKAQIAAVLEDFEVGAIKIGMLGSAEIARAVAEALQPPPPSWGRVGEGGRRGAATGGGSQRNHPPSLTLPHEGGGDRAVRQDASASKATTGPHPDPLPQAGEGETPFLVFDPVMAASSGDSLAGAGLLEAIRTLLPLVDLLTPNLGEAAALLQQQPACDEEGMIAQGRALLDLGPCAVLIKGGHLEGDAVDLLVTAEAIHRFAAPRIASANLHGTGCTLSSAVAAYVALGLDLASAVAEAKTFTRRAIENALACALGRGAGPLLQIPLRLPPGRASA